MTHRWRSIAGLLLALLVGAAAWMLAGQRPAGLSRYAFVVLHNAGPTFSFLLMAVFLAGMAVILDQVSRWFVYVLVAARVEGHPVDASGCALHVGVFGEFMRFAREFRARSEEGVYSDDIVANARQAAIDSVLDGEGPGRGCAFLEFLAVAAPTIGFVGTLTGLIDAFQVLGAGGELNHVLVGLGVSMSTSLIGAAMSILFLAMAWGVRWRAGMFDLKLARLVAVAQERE